MILLIYLIGCLLSGIISWFMLDWDSGETRNLNDLLLLLMFIIFSWVVVIFCGMFQLIDKCSKTKLIERFDTIIIRKSKNYDAF